MKVSSDIDSANDANSKMVSIIESKQLLFNFQKSLFVVLGEKKARKALLDKLQLNPPLSH